MIRDNVKGLATMISRCLFRFIGDYFYCENALSKHDTLSYPKSFNAIVKEIENTKDKDQLDILLQHILAILSNSDLIRTQNMGLVILITDHFKKKAYALTDDIVKIQYSVEQIYVHAIYEKMKF